MNYKFKLIVSLIYLLILNPRLISAQQLIMADSLNTKKTTVVEYEMNSNNLDYPLNKDNDPINKLPIIEFEISPVSGGEAIAPVWMKFYPIGTYDPDGYIVLFEMDMNGDGIFDIREEFLKGGSFEFSKAGTFSAIVKVTDDDGGITTKIKTFNIFSSEVSDVELNGSEIVTYSDINSKLEKQVTSESMESNSRSEVDTVLDSIIYNISLQEDKYVQQNEEIEQIKYDQKRTTKDIDDIVISEMPDYENDAIITRKSDLKNIEHIEIRSEVVVDEPLAVSNDSNNFYSIADSYVYEYSYRNWDEANFGNDKLISCGWHSTGGEKRAYLNFDLSSSNEFAFKKAILKLYHVNTIGRKNMTLGVYRVKGAWMEGEGILHDGLVEEIDSTGVVTWKNQPDYNTDYYAKFDIHNNTDRYIEIDITNLVMYWTENGGLNSIVIKPYGEKYKSSPTSISNFYSRENGDISKSPIIELIK